MRETIKQPGLYTMNIKSSDLLHNTLISMVPLCCVLSGVM